MSTYTPIASQTLSSAAASVTFSGIPQTYTDLVLVMVAKLTTSGLDDVGFRFNSDSGSNYSRTWLEGNGSTTGSGRASNETDMAIAGYYDSTNWTTQVTHFFNYSNSTTFKTAINRESTSYGNAGAKVGLWRNTAAITQIAVSPRNSKSFASGSTFNLYGIDAQASAQAKATGGTTIIRDSNYWYHVFTGSGTFTPTQAITADILCIAGGGSGGAGRGGGGGAGGLLAHTSQSLLAQAYTVTVGAGGAQPSTNTSDGNKGSNSQFGSLTASEGGGKGTSAYQGTNGGNGGSGGGAAATGTGGTATSGQGNNGGAGAPTSNNFRGTGGGGGAGGAGGAGSDSTNTGGAGGVGSSSYSSWGSATSTGQLSSGTYYYAGGGGGGTFSAGTASGGLGGGGNSGTSAVAGTANTGGGGGGASQDTSGNPNNAGAGGSGIVIIRYAV